MNAVKLSVLRCLSMGLIFVVFYTNVSFGNADNQSREQSNIEILKTPQVEMPILKKDLKKKVEALTAVSFDGAVFKAKVISHGCTSSEDFTVQYELVDKSCKITLVREKPDMCRRAPMLFDIEVNWKQPEDCNGIPLFVANPVLVTGSERTMFKRLK